MLIYFFSVLITYNSPKQTKQKLSLVLLSLMVLNRTIYYKESLIGSNWFGLPKTPLFKFEQPSFIAYFFQLIPWRLFPPFDLQEEVLPTFIFETGFTFSGLGLSHPAGDACGDRHYSSCTDAELESHLAMRTDILLLTQVGSACLFPLRVMVV